MLSSDEDILHATSNTLQLFEASNFLKSRTRSSCVNQESASKNEDSKAEFFESKLMREGDNVFCHSLDFEKNIFANQPSYMEFETAAENIAMINELYNHYLEKMRKFQEQEPVSYIQDYSAVIMSTSSVSKRIDQMKAVINHIQTIVAEEKKLKQVLRSNILNDVWKINKDYHKAVVSFFKMASELMKDIEKFIISLECSKSYNSENSVVLRNKEMKFLAVLQENMENLEEFRKYVQCTCNDAV